MEESPAERNLTPPRPPTSTSTSTSTETRPPSELQSQPQQQHHRHRSTHTLTSPSISYSTTDDEDMLSLSAPVRTQLHPQPHPSSSSTLASTSTTHYFPTIPPSSTGNNTSLQRRRSSKKYAKSPLSLASALPPVVDPEYDYGETEWWGWLILGVTWSVFVAGMGSCLGVWSWAWDVGTTPYAPPELEDDPTLPVVGYYPSLMILTCVMAWIWVLTAWVGMKYFRHAKITGD